MTMLEQAISKRALAALDRVRKQRGLRSRAKTLEVLLLELAPEDEEIPSPAEAKIIKARLAEMARGEVVAASLVFERIGYTPKR